MNANERRFLERARRGFLATADTDGRPAAVPVCFALVDDRGDDVGAETTIVTPVDEKPKDAAPTDLRRVRDVRADPRVTFLVDRYDEDWSRLAWIQVRGTGEITDPGASEHGAAIAVLTRKYDQYADHALGERPVIRIDPGHVVSWGDLTGESEV